MSPKILAKGTVLSPGDQILAQTLLQCTFADCSEGVYIWMRADSKFFNIARLYAKTKTLEVLIRKLLFTDDAALASHSEAGLQRLVDNLSHTCKEFALTIRLKKASILARDAQTPPVINTLLYGGHS